MQFLDARPFTPDNHGEWAWLAAMTSYRVTDTERMRAVLAQLQRQEAPVTVGRSQKEALFGATLCMVDADGNRLVFHAAQESKVPAIFAGAGRLWGTAYDGHCKVQFDLRGCTLMRQDAFWAVTSHLPSAMFVLPRRSEVRARHAREPVVRFRHPQSPQQALELRVHDISRGGLALLAHPDEAPLQPGVQVCGALIELAPGDFASADFRVNNVALHDEADATFRFGCAWTKMNAQAAELVDAWTQRAARRKRVGPSVSLDL